jgi:hypothetical protein
MIRFPQKFLIEQHRFAAALDAWRSCRLQRREA